MSRNSIFKRFRRYSTATFSHDKPELIARARARARQLNMSFSGFMVTLIEEGLKRRRKPGAQVPPLMKQIESRYLESFPDGRKKVVYRRDIGGKTEIEEIEFAADGSKLPNKHNHDLYRAFSGDPAALLGNPKPKTEDQ